MKLAWVAPDQPLPDPGGALDDPPGLLAAGLDLSPDRLLEAYGKGIFPWYSDGQPVLWWSPDPRMVLRPADFRLSRSLRQTMRRAHARGRWTVTLDRAFETVMRECARPRPDQDGTWITDEIVAAYTGLHRRGLAHSVEVWASDNDGRPARLVGGLYGVALGRAFFGESMFARETDASKAALAALVALLRGWSFELIDCQQVTAHLASLGAAPLPRAHFLQRLARAAALPAADWSSAAIAFPLDAGPAIGDAMANASPCATGDSRDPLEPRPEPSR